MGWPEFHEACRAAGGVVSLRATADAADLAPSVVRRRAKQEGWWWPFHDVVATPGTRVDGRARAQAATLYTRGTTNDPERNVVGATRWTAAYLLGVHLTPPTRPQILIHSSRVLAHAGQEAAVKARPDRFRVEVRRSRGLSAEHVAVVQHVPTVVGTRFVRDLAAVSDRARLRAVVIDLAKKGGLCLDELSDRVDAWRRFPGRPVVRQVLDDLGAAGRTDSPLEYVARGRFEDAGIALDVGQVPVPIANGSTLHCDLGILAIRFAIEVDSMGFHSDRVDLTNDATRTNAIMAVEDRWRVMRLTWDLLEPRRWDDLVTQVRQVIATQSRLHLGIDWPRPEHLHR